MEKALAGVKGKLDFGKSAAQEFLPVGGGLLTEAVNGAQVTLTLDHTVQYLSLIHISEPTRPY